MDVYFHNDETRLTMIRRGKSAYTFKLPDNRFKKGATAQLIYFIESDDARIVKQHRGNDVYVQAFFTAYDTEEDIRLKGNGFAESSMILYKVSEEESQSQ